MITASQIRKIHTLKHIIGLDDDSYFELLFSFNVQSSKNLTYADAVIVIETLEKQALALNRWEKYPLKYEQLERNNMATPAQLRMIEGIWREICYYDSDTFAKKSLRKFLKSKFKVDDVMFITKANASKVIYALQAIKKNSKHKKSAATLN